MKNLALTLLPALAGLGLTAPSSCAPTTLPPCIASSFVPYVPANATIESAVQVDASGSYAEPGNIAYPQPATSLPASTCAVIVRVPTSSTTAFRVGLLLPPPGKWNARILTVGNGAFAGGINWADAGVGVSGYGFASVSTDTGHNSSGIDLSWALGAEGKVEDFGWRAVHGSVLVGKRVVKGYYGAAAERSYYSGCSTGGRQGLREAMVDPNAFDGLLVGAPAWWSSHLSTWTARLGVWNLPADSPGHIPVPLMVGLLAREAVKQCDAADGVTDGIVSKPDDCRIDFTPMLCGRNGTDATDCLTLPQVDTARRVYGEYYAEGRFAFPGFSIGSEPQWPVVLGDPTGPSPLGSDYIRYMLLQDPQWRWQDYNDSLVWLADALDPGQQTADQFDALVDYGLGVTPDDGKGGKVLMYHGWADGLISSRSSRVFFDRLAAAHAACRTTGKAKMDSYLRLFMVPGMGHCAGPVAAGAPWYFAGSGQQAGLPPGVTVAGDGTDALRALMAWVEDGTPTESLVATAFDASGAVARQRPLCPWPKQAVLRPGRNETLAESWRCS